MRSLPIALLAIVTAACSSTETTGTRRDANASATDGPAAADAAAAAPDAAGTDATPGGQDAAGPDAARDGSADAGTSPDGGPPDAAPGDAENVDSGPLGIGTACTDDSECPNRLLCLNERVNPILPRVGYCTAFCFMDPDCREGYCSVPLMGVQVCLLPCGAGRSCSFPAHVCSDRLAGFLPLGRDSCLPGNPSAIDGSPCTSFADCARNQVCLLNRFEAPGGSCITYGCTIGDSSTCTPGGDARCVQVGNDAICLDTCMRDTDCRSNEGYACLDPGFGTRTCAARHAPAGSACAVVADCGSPPWECLTGLPFPGGHCGARNCSSADINTCPANTRCYDPTPAMATNGDQHCARSCAVATDCRRGEGYDCLLLNPAMPAMGRVCRKP